MKILLVDNYDSFTFNLLHLFSQIKDVDVIVMRNDEDFIQCIKKDNFDGVIISPGPGNPNDKSYFGDNMKLIEQHGLRGLPILGVCLGFQGIACFFGAQLKKAVKPMHGKTSKLNITKNDKLLNNLPNDIDVMRYHSLMIDTGQKLPQELVITAETNSEEDSVAQNGRELMAFHHKTLPIYGVQFHPESFATQLGSTIANNFVNIIKEN